MFKTIIARVGEAITLVAFFLGSLTAVADIFGLLDKFPTIQELLPRITLLLVGILGSAVILQHWISIKDIENDARKAAEKTNSIEHILKSVDELSYPTRLVTNRADMMSGVLNALSSAPPNALVDVTHFEKLLGSQYDVGEGGIEEHFMDQWDKKVKSGEIQVRQIVHVSSLLDLRACY